MLLMWKMHFLQSLSIEYQSNILLREGDNIHSQFCTRAIVILLLLLHSALHTRPLGILDFRGASQCFTRLECIVLIVSGIPSFLDVTARSYKHPRSGKHTLENSRPTPQEDCLSGIKNTLLFLPHPTTNTESQDLVGSVSLRPILEGRADSPTAWAIWHLNIQWCQA